MLDPDKLFQLASKVGYTGPPDQGELDKYLSSNPGLASKFGKYVDYARQIMDPNPKMNFAEGGWTTQDYDNLDPSTFFTQDGQLDQGKLQALMANNPNYTINYDKDTNNLTDAQKAQLDAAYKNTSTQYQQQQGSNASWEGEYWKNPETGKTERRRVANNPSLGVTNLDQGQLYNSMSPVQRSPLTFTRTDVTGGQLDNNMVKYDPATGVTTGGGGGGAGLTDPSSIPTAPDGTRQISNAGVIQYGQGPKSTITQAFKYALGRDPDPEGFAYWMDQVNNGMPVTEVVDRIANSDEATSYMDSIQKVNMSDPQEAIRQAYRNFLGREPDEGGLKYYLQKASSGTPIMEIFNEIGASDEAKNYTEASGSQFDANMRNLVLEASQGFQRAGVASGDPNVGILNQQTGKAINRPYTEGAGPLGIREAQMPWNMAGTRDVQTTKNWQGAKFLMDQLDAAQGTLSEGAQMTGPQGELSEGAMFEGAQGELPMEAIAKGVQMDPNTLAQLGLSPAQIEEYQRIVAPDPRELQQGELVDGSSVDMQEADAASFEAQTAQPSEQATVQGQYAELMADFDAKEPPAWAAGALRSAMAQMQERGLGASSIAGQAMIQAAMESALPIAQQDAATYAQFEQQNLSNRQQAAMFAAEQRANFLGMKFDQDFQSKVYNATRITEIANQNYSTEVQIALENARMAQSVDLANLQTRHAKTMADAAAMTQVDLTNLVNLQEVEAQNTQNFAQMGFANLANLQAAGMQGAQLIANMDFQNLQSRITAAQQNARSFLEMDMANLSNEQQTTMFKAQERINALFNDTAADNAMKQFNATNKQQNNQFFANLSANVSQFNASQQNAMRQFNTSEFNSMQRFNAELVAQRDLFNAQNSLIIAQSNAKWRQDVNTLATQAQNEANMEYAKTINAMSGATLEQYWQRERDILDYAFTSSESAADRGLSIFMERLRQEGYEDAIKLQGEIESDMADKEAKGRIVGTLVGGVLEKFAEGVFG